MHEDVLQKLQEKGYFVTELRKTLLDLFDTSEFPLSVPDILSALAEQGITVNKTTVYREIEKLLQEAIILPVRLENDKVHYEWAFREHHHHIRCEKCHALEDVTLGDNTPALVDLAAKETSYMITGHSLEFSGICPRCQENN